MAAKPTPRPPATAPAANKSETRKYHTDKSSFWVGNIYYPPGAIAELTEAQAAELDDLLDLVEEEAPPPVIPLNNPAEGEPQTGGGDNTNPDAGEENKEGENGGGENANANVVTDNKEGKENGKN